MSLNFSFIKVQPELVEDSAERKEFFDKAWDSGMLESMIFATMFLGIRDIKDEDTAEMFYQRHVMHYASQGAEPFLTLDFIKSMIGLSTNASTKTDAVFKKDLYENLIQLSLSKLQAARG